MKIEKPTLTELREELIANAKELMSDIFLLECLIQYHNGAFEVSGDYSDEDCGLALCRMVDYICGESGCGKTTITRLITVYEDSRVEVTFKYQHNYERALDYIQSIQIISLPELAVAGVM